MAGDVEKRVTAKYILDDSGFSDKLQGVNQQLKLNQSELKNAQVGMQAFGKNSDSLKSVQQALGTQIETQSKKVDLYRQSIEKVSAKMQENISQRDKLKSALDQEQAKLNGAIQAYGKESQVTQNVSEKVKELTDEYNAKQKAVESNARSITTYTTNMNKADTELTKLQGNLNKTTEELNKNNNGWLTTSKNLKESGNKLTDAGDKISGVGDKILGLTAPLVGATVAGVKFSNDFQDGLAKISTIADTTQMSMKDIGNGVIDLSNKTGKSVGDLNDGLYEAISSGIQTGDAVNFMSTATKAAVGGFTDTNTAVDGLTTVLNSYGLKASEVTNISNQMMVAQNLGKTTFGEMAQQMGNVTPIASALGVKTNELFSSLAVLTANGIQTREAVTGLKAAMSNIIKPSKEASDAAYSLGINFDANTVKTKGWLPFLQDVKDKLKQASPEFAKVSDEITKLTSRQLTLEQSGKKSSEEYKQNVAQLKALKNEFNSIEQASNGPLSAFATMFGSVEGLNSILTLTSDQGVSLYNDGMKQMASGANLTDDAFNKMDNTAGNKLRKSLNELKNSAINLGDAAQPLLEDVTGLLSKLASVLQNTDKGTLKFVEDVGLAVGAFGLLTKGLGIAVGAVGTWKTGIGGIAGIIGNFTTATATATVAAEATAGATAGVGAAAEVAGAGLGGLAIAAAPWLLAGAGVVALGVGIHHELTQEATPAVDLFATSVKTSTTSIKDSNGQLQQSYNTTVTKISDGTKQAVGAYMKLDDGAKKSLSDLYVNGNIITDQTVQSLTSKYNQMGTQIKAGMDKHYQDEYNTMQQFFQKSTALSDSEKASALVKLQQDSNNKKAIIDNYEQQIQAILQNALNNHRSLSLQEEQQINSIQEQMRTNAVNSLSSTEVESKVILQRLNDYGNRITAEQASSEIKNANKARDESVNAANEQYNKTLAAIIQMRDGTHSITSDQADKLIADAKRQKDDSIKHAEELRSQAVEKITSMNRDIKNNVDTNTGNILTIWDRLKTWWNNWFPAPKNLNVNTNAGSRDFSSNAPPPQYSGGWIGQNASGTNHFEGGLTTMHEKGYEVYNLPRGSKIYNHEASEDLVMKTAQSVATKVANNILGSVGSNNSSSIGDIYLTMPIYLDGNKIYTSSDKIQGSKLKTVYRNGGMP